MPIRRRGGIASATLVVLFTAAAVIGARAADRLALWRIVHEKCAPDEKENASPAPCERVDLAGGEDNGVAILKDLVGVAQFLAIPTRRITGIEAPEILDPAAPNYWRAAWAAKPLLEARLGHELPRDAVGLAINSSIARSQDQLHIHIDCVAADTRAALAAHADEIGADWRGLSFKLTGRQYWARRLDSTDLADVAPFRLLADGVEGASTHMPLETLVVIGATFASGPGFVLLSDRADLASGDLAHGEDLLDHSCAVAK
ncbi:MAG TPA: CDP-diacylglycerol diphosphatase [Roseiarcus sp.]|nr:CDP-diacylglycerol diphosphatase [Roseiarcus sp.]